MGPASGTLRPQQTGSRDGSGAPSPKNLPDKSWVCAQARPMRKAFRPGYKANQPSIRPTQKASSPCSKPNQLLRLTACALIRVRGRLSRGDSGDVRRESLPPAPPPPCFAPLEAHMLDTLTAPRDEDDFNTVAECRPDRGGFLPEARTSTREAAGHMKNLAERDHASARHSVLPRPRRAPPPASPSREHLDGREGQPRRRHHCHCRRKRLVPVITANRPRRLKSALVGQRKTRWRRTQRCHTANVPAFPSQRAMRV